MPCGSATTGTGFKAKWEELSGKGLRLVNLEVYGPSVS